MNPHLKIKNFFSHKHSLHHPPHRGEIWIEPHVLESIGLSNDAVGIAILPLKSIYQWLDHYYQNS